jgi:hypothetical protein
MTLSDAADQCSRMLLGFKLKLFSDYYHSSIGDYFKKAGQYKRRALLVYRSLPFLVPRRHPIFRCHQSMEQALVIARILDEMGFVVDVADYTRRSLSSQHSYDLVVSHNCFLDPRAEPWHGALKIYLASGTEHSAHNNRQRERLCNFEARVGRQDVELVWDAEEMPWAEKADAIFCFGNDEVAETWRRRFSCPVLSFQNTASESIHGTQRHWNRASKEFLFLGSRQQLAKGLDLLIEVFADCPELNLHICGHYRRDVGFCKIYRDAFRLPNIHGHGWVDMGSRKMDQLATRCGFAVSATCAEGSPGSITNMMKTGMVALLPTEAGLDFGHGVLRLSISSIAEIKDAVRNFANMSPETLATISAEALGRAAKDFSIQAFSMRWRTMLESTLAGRFSA